jgi:hypothetical protein
VTAYYEYDSDPAPAAPIPQDLFYFQAWQPLGTHEARERAMAEYKAPSRADAIREEVAEKYNISIEKMTFRTHKRVIAWARQEYMYRLATELEWSQPQIGEHLGMHHTSVLYGIHGHAERNGAPIPERYARFRPA